MVVMHCMRSNLNDTEITSLVDLHVLPKQCYDFRIQACPLGTVHDDGMQTMIDWSTHTVNCEYFVVKIFSDGLACAKIKRMKIHAQY